MGLFLTGRSWCGRVKKNTFMNEELRFKMEKIIEALSIHHHCQTGSVEQIGNYHGTISLTQFTDQKFSIGSHQRGDYGHIMLINQTISDIQQDFNTSKKILPIVLFTIKYRPKRYVRMEPGELHRIPLSDMSEELLGVFIKLQQLVCGPLIIPPQ